MKLGIISDPHLGYFRGTKVHPDGTNVREADVYEAAYKGVRNLLAAGVDAIVDLGDLANAPHPKKRAVIRLISLINSAGMDWYSCGGNHTAQKTSSDAHLYELLVAQCPRFHGAFHGPTFFEDIGAYLIPYDTPENVEAALAQVPDGATFVGGHWSCDDADWKGEHVQTNLLPDTLPVLLGHWHKRSVDQNQYLNIPRPTYVGATERFAWGEATNPTGVAVFDSENCSLTFIEHEARRWVDIHVTPDDYLEEAHYEDIEGAIVRVNITTTPDQYHSLDLLRVEKKLAASLEHQVRRVGHSSPEVYQDAGTQSLSIIEGYKSRIARAEMPKGISRSEVERIGLEALMEYAE